MTNLPQTQAPSNFGGGDFAAPQQLRGTTAKWDKERNWFDQDGRPLPSPMLVVGTDTLLVRWYPEYADIREKPLPNANLLNSAIPRSEWRAGLNGEPEPPWKLNFEIRMVDPASSTLYVYRNSTYGARVCFERLNEAVCIARMLRGSAVLPVVRLDKRPMPTQRGMQSRPHLEAIEYREPHGSPATPLPSPPPAPQLPPAATPAPVAPAPAPAAAAAAPASPPPTTIEAMKPVEPIRIEEVISDSMPPWA